MHDIAVMCPVLQIIASVSRADSNTYLKYV